MLTPSATRFVGPLSFAALSRHPVETDVLDLLPDGRIGHIVIADTADALVVAPATAHWLGAMANGLAGDVVTATCLATSRPGRRRAGDGRRHVDATRRRSPTSPGCATSSATRSSRRSRAARLGPVGRRAAGRAAGDRRCGRRGRRRSPGPAPDAAARPPVVGPAREADLAGRHIVITAGGTREPIDPVRFIGNRSTGKMGVALAEAALARGARVTLIAADVEVALPTGADVVRVETTAELRAALLRGDPRRGRRRRFDALVMAAAVADFRPATPRPTEARPRRRPDPRARADPGPARRDRPDRPRRSTRTAAPAAAAPPRPSSSASPRRPARSIARRRSCGARASTSSSPTTSREAGSGFGTDTNRVAILAADGSRDDLPLLSKREVADRLLDRVAARVGRARRGGAD